MQARARAWLAMPARRSAVRSTAGSESRVVMTVKPCGGEEWTEAGGEGEGYFFFEGVVGEVGAGVGVRRGRDRGG